jgi:DNA polymerase (family 10)
VPVYNSDVSEIFRQVADLLEIEGANQYRVRAYRNAARTIGTLSEDIVDMVEEGQDLTELSGIGEDMAGKIKEIVKTGDLAQLGEIKSRTPPALAEMLKIEGLGPKRVQTLYKELDITDLGELEEKAKSGTVRELEGFGEKTEQKIIDSLEKERQEEKRTRLNIAEELVEPLVDHLKAIEGVQQVKVAGSYRRRKETVGDLDILATGAEGEEIIGSFVDYEDVEEVLSQGETRSTVLLRRDIQVDLRVVAQESYGAALLYFTGSKAHNIELRNMALDEGRKVNEYGVFEDEERIAGETETEIYELFDLPYIEPELRENRGEIEAAQNGELPDLVTLEDIRGDLQCHTTDSDGHASMKEMAQAAQERGYDYLAITDHSSHIGVTQGLNADALAQQIEEVERLNEELDGIRILKASEVDILEDGSLDLPDEILEKLDVCVCSIHSHFDLSRDQQAERIIRAMDNPNFNILAHPTGRRIHERAPYEVNMQRLLEAALERGCFLEVNAQPDRLDLKDVDAKLAQEIGVKLAISTDAHRPAELEYMRFGVGQARRGWLGADDVLNTRPWEDLKKLLRRE